MVNLARRGYGLQTPDPRRHAIKMDKKHPFFANLKMDIDAGQHDKGLSAALHVHFSVPSSMKWETCVSSRAGTEPSDRTAGIFLCTYSLLGMIQLTNKV